MSTKIIKSNDELIKVELNSKILDLDDQKVVLSVLRDISDRKEIAQKLSSEKVKVKKLHDLLDRLIYLSKSFNSYSLNDQELFLKDILDVAYNNIEKADNGYISIYKNQDWKLVKVIGYNNKTVKILNKKRDRLLNEFKKDYNNKIIRINNLNPQLFLSENISKELNDMCKTISEQIKESLFFEQRYNDKKIRLSLDIGAESKLTFNDNSEILMTLFKNFLYAYINVANNQLPPKS